MEAKVTTPAPVVGQNKFLGINFTVENVIKAAGLLITATLLVANMNSNAEKLGLRIDAKYELIETKMENFEWRMQQVEKKIDKQEQRDFERIRQQKP